MSVVCRFRDFPDPLTCGRHGPDQHLRPAYPVHTPAESAPVRTDRPYHASLPASPAGAGEYCFHCRGYRSVTAPLPDAGLPALPDHGARNWRTRPVPARASVPGRQYAGDAAEYKSQFHPLCAAARAPHRPDWRTTLINPGPAGAVRQWLLCVLWQLLLRHDAAPVLLWWAPARPCAPPCPDCSVPDTPDGCI